MVRLFNKTISLLNRHEKDSFSDEYYISKIQNVCAQVYISSNNNATNSANVSRCSLFIKKGSLPKSYLEPKKWLDSNSKASYLTFKDDDYVVIGDISETSITNINTIYNKYDNVFKISSSSYFDILNSFQIKAV